MARTLLGTLMLAMAALQVTSFGGFVDIMGDYQIGPAPVAASLAVALIVAEAAAGAGLLARRSGAGNAAVGVALAWSALAVQAFARGLVLDNCGCFGVHLGQPLGWWVLLEDAQLVAWALWVRHQMLTGTALDEPIPVGVEGG